MRHLKASGIVVVSLVVTMLLGLAGCGRDHSDRFHGDRDNARYERHEDHGQDSGHEGGHG
jgi:hypothetical protein